MIFMENSEPIQTDTEINYIRSKLEMQGNILSIKYCVLALVFLAISGTSLVIHGLMGLFLLLFGVAGIGWSLHRSTFKEIRYLNELNDYRKIDDKETLMSLGTQLENFPDLCHQFVLYIKVRGYIIQKEYDELISSMETAKLKTEQSELNAEFNKKLVTWSNL